MANKNRGFIKVYRSIDEHWVWDDRPYSKGQAWIDLLLLANHKSEKFEAKGVVVEGSRGCVYRSITYLAQRWGWSRWKVNRFISALESDGMLHIERTSNRTVLTLINYDDFQDRRTSDLSVNQQKTDSEPTYDRQRTDTYKNDKNVKNVKKKRKEAAPQSFYSHMPGWHIQDGWELWKDENGSWHRALIGQKED